MTTPVLTMQLTETTVPGRFILNITGQSPRTGSLPYLLNAAQEKLESFEEI